MDGEMIMEDYGWSSESSADAIYACRYPACSHGTAQCPDDGERLTFYAHAPASPLLTSSDHPEQFSWSWNHPLL
jgi:hypothetical protein